MPSCLCILILFLTRLVYFGVNCSLMTTKLNCILIFLKNYSKFAKVTNICNSLSLSLCREHAATKGQYTPVFFAPGDVCMAIFSEDNQWYRGVVEDIGDEVCVLLLLIF